MSLRGHHNATNLLIETARFLVVRLGRSYFALSAAGVRGLLTKEDTGGERAVTAEGAVYQSVDLAQRLSVAADLSGSDMRIILYSNGQARGAIQVEEVVGLIDVERKDCFPLPAHFQRDERKWFMGMMLSHDRLVLILHSSWVLEKLADPPASTVLTGRMIGESQAAVDRSC
jgi:hypothetical protein